MRDLAVLDPTYDIAFGYADPGLATREPGWQTWDGHAELPRDIWRWQLANPQGNG